MDFANLQRGHRSHTASHSGDDDVGAALLLSHSVLALLSLLVLLLVLLVLPVLFILLITSNQEFQSACDVSSPPLFQASRDVRMPANALLPASALRCLPASGIVPLEAQGVVKSETQSAESGEFLRIRAMASREPATFEQLRERCGLLRGAEGMRGCHHNTTAAHVLRSAVQWALDSENWRELWVLLAMLQHWMQVMDVAGANTCWPFWLVQSDEQRAGGSLGTGIQVLDAPCVSVDGESSTPPVASVKVELPEAAATETPVQHAPLAVVSTGHPSGRLQRRVSSCERSLSLADFPPGAQVLTPRYDDEHGRGEYYSYCTVMAHREGRLRVEIEGEAPYNLSLAQLQWTGDRYGMPLKRPSLPSASGEQEAPPAAQSRQGQANDEPSSRVLVVDDAVAVAAEKRAPVDERAEEEMQTAPDAKRRRRQKPPEPSEQPSQVPNSVAVKLESEARAQSAQRAGQRGKDQETLDKEALRDRYLREQRTVLGRHCFRKGTTGATIATVLGGGGMDPWPVVSKPKPHGFVQAGEAYFAGNRAYNPTSPAYAGDTGLVKTKCIPRAQKYFHVFAQCTTLDKTVEPHRPRQPCTSWHGQSCAGAFFYCGLYKRDCDCEERRCACKAEEFRNMCTLPFDQMRTINGGLDAEWAHTRWYFEHPKCDEVGFASEADMMSKLQSGGYYEMIDPELLEEEALNEDAKDYGLHPQTYRHRLALREYLRKKNFVYELMPIRFVEYPEEVYAALVKAKAWSPHEPRMETALEKLGLLG